MAKLRVLFIGGTGVISSTPLRNPFLRYSRDKIACEKLAAGWSPR
jgi:hypothetical protein